jgi:hypothetical protein
VCARELGCAAPALWDEADWSDAESLMPPSLGEAMPRHSTGSSKHTRYLRVNQDALGSAARCARVAAAALTAGFSVVIDATNLTPQKRSQWTGLAEAHAVRCRCVCFRWGFVAPIVMHHVGLRQGADPPTARMQALEAEDRSGGADKINARVVLQQMAQLQWPRLDPASTTGTTPPPDWLTPRPCRSGVGAAPKPSKQASLSAFFGSKPALAAAKATHPSLSVGCEARVTEDGFAEVVELGVCPGPFESAAAMAGFYSLTNCDLRSSGAARV